MHIGLHNSLQQRRPHAAPQEPQQGQTSPHGTPQHFRLKCVEYL